ncbi:MAG: isoprenylcysteine carboxylmethyltransferase family protein [Anaerolineae bacterium]|nr:isoprenylcysteine carboxylmethyltransferase family protein [Anaerolineae bacterium]
MNASVSTQQTDPKSRPRTLKLLLAAVIYALVLAVVLVLLSGRVDWLMAWGLAIVMGITTGVTILFAPADREFIEERTRIKADVKSWDKPLGVILSVAPFAVFIVAGLDMRYSWSSPVAAAVQVGALVIVLVAQLGYAWAIASNKFFARFVRIQKERGHTVVSSGPYRFVRHPGYATGLLTILAAALALGSLWALIPGGLVVLLGILRTALEDRTLQNELPGYKEYARRVRYRLLPGVW